MPTCNLCSYSQADHAGPDDGDVRFKIHWRTVLQMAE
jgi:hypothetical protein